MVALSATKEGPKFAIEEIKYSRRTLYYYTITLSNLLLELAIFSI